MVNYIAGFILEVTFEYSFTTIAKCVSFTEFGFYLREDFFLCQWVPLKVVEEFQDRYGDGHSGSGRFVGGAAE
jgi:hypothetical protein